MNPQEQKAFFEKQGYLIVADLLSPEEITACQTEIQRLHKLAAELEAKGERGHFQREPYAKDAIQGADLPVLRKAENTRQYSEVFRQLSEHPKLITVVQNLIGTDLLLFRSTLMFKPAFYGSAHGIHQDSAYWPIDPPTLVTVSIALNDATPENGCFKILPKSHKWGLQNWGRIARDQDESLTDRDDLDLSGQTDVPLSAGSALFFHSLLAHGSGPNQTPNSRNTALYAYFSPHVRYTPRGGQPADKTYPVVAGLDGRKELTLIAEKAQ
ncbi:MAG: phytanoyl-CoA dioxygenase family protein [Candidatus Poribacteria bacterium]|nr:phytanoyl-CoA dioxygenase family protein [Candidatus Poribacteria bacterium]